MSNMIRKSNDIKSEKELKDELIKLSKTSNFVYCASEHFGTVKFYEYKTKSSIPVDSPQSRTMLSVFGGVGFQNGKLVQPTKSWLKRNNRIPFRD